jgi:hypothetical protein
MVKDRMGAEEDEEAAGVPKREDDARLKMWFHAASSGSSGGERSMS